MTSRSCTADTFKILTECLEYRPSLRNAHKRLMVEVPLHKGKRIRDAALSIFFYLFTFAA